MRVLLIGNAYSIHMYHFVKYTLLDELADQIVIFNLKGNRNNSVKELEENIHHYYMDHKIEILPELDTFNASFETIINSLLYLKNSGRFHVCHVHYLDSYAVLAGILMRSYCDILIANYWGSDWLRAEDSLKMFQKNLLEVSDAVVTDSMQIYNQINTYFDFVYHTKCHYIRFKLPIIETLKSNGQMQERKNSFLLKYKIPCHKTVICCGYNGNKAHCHIPIINAISNLQQELTQKIFVIIPTSYGKDISYLDNIKRTLAKTNINYLVLEEYLEQEEVAALRLITDIFINMQSSDAYSSTLLEYTFCNKIIINGAWLDYSALEKAGAYFEKVNNFSQLSHTLSECLENFKERAKLFQYNRLANEKFQSDYDGSHLWIELYQKKVYIDTHEDSWMEKIISYATKLEIQKHTTERKNSEILQHMLSIDDLDKKVSIWASTKKYKNISIYGAGNLGKILYLKLRSYIPETIYIFDRTEKISGWFPGQILLPEQLSQTESDIIIITPSFYMWTIKEEYSATVTAKIITITEWLEEIEHI